MPKHKCEQHQFSLSQLETPTYLFHVISIEVITALAAIDASTLGINAVLAEPEPARGFGAIRGSNYSRGEAVRPNSSSGAQKP